MAVDQLCITRSQAMQFQQLGWPQEDSLFYINDRNGDIFVRAMTKRGEFNAAPTFDEMFKRIPLTIQVSEQKGKITVIVSELQTGIVEALGKTIAEAYGNLLLKLAKNGTIELGDNLPF